MNNQTQFFEKVPESDQAVLTTQGDQSTTLRISKDETEQSIVSPDHRDDDKRLLFGEIPRQQVLKSRKTNKLIFENETMNGSIEDEIYQEGKSKFVRVSGTKRGTLTRICNENDIEVTRRTCTIRNDGIRKAYYDAFMDIILTYSVITSLYFLGFDSPEGPLLIVDIIVQVIFFLDLVLTFFFEILDEHDQPIRKLSIIAKNYLTGWFFFDVVALIPFRFFGYKNASYLCRLSRLAKMPRALDLFSEHGIGRAIGIILGQIQVGDRTSMGFAAKYLASWMQMLLTMSLLCYTFGCFWYWYVRVWEGEAYAVKHLQNFKDFHDIEAEPNGLQLLISWYFMMTTLTTVGYGDYLPQNMYEYGLMCLIMLIGAGWFAYIMGSFNSAVQEFNDVTAGEDILAALNIWIENLEREHGKLSFKLKRQIIDHFAHYWEHDRLGSLRKCYWTESVSEQAKVTQEYMKDLPEHTQNQIMDFLYDDIFYKFRIFLGKSKFKYAICYHFQPR